MATSRIIVQQADFSVAGEYRRLSRDNSDGALVTFVGKVRDFNDAGEVSRLTLEHYPGMTEKVLTRLAERARARWDVNHITVIHRVGAMTPGERIVFIGVSGAHRQAAFDACGFLIDFLKTEAPLWKLEATGDGDKWAGARDSDARAAGRWR